MKTQLILACLLPSAICLSALAQDTAFTYQGRLNDGANPASGSYDLTFALFDASSGGSQRGGVLTNAATGVSNGLFTVTLDFGNQFPGTARWLEIGVRTNGGGAFSALSPRQEITPTPYAITAGSSSNLLGTLSPTGLAGTYSPPVSLTNAGNSFRGSFSGNGGALTNLNAWKLTGNTGTIAGSHFIGTTDNEPLEIKVNGDPVMRYQPGGVGNPPNVLGGRSSHAAADTFSVTIGGGYYNSSDSSDVTIAGGSFNHIGPATAFETIGGGIRNRIEGGPTDVVIVGGSVIAGGKYNTVGFNSPLSTISGGVTNVIGTNSIGSTISGGVDNAVGTNAEYNTISGGTLNRIRNGTGNSVVGGGNRNTLDSDLGVIGGGYHNHIDSPSPCSVISGGSNNIVWESITAGTIAGGTGNTLETGADYSTVGGGIGNRIFDGSQSSTISGGSENEVVYASYSSIAGGSQNQVYPDYSFIGGGSGNYIQANAAYSVIAGGYGNGVNAYYSTINGGQNNGIGASAGHAVISGGFLNNIGEQASYATIGGGTENTIEDSANYSTVGGGSGNVIKYSGGRSFIGGGGGNVVSNNSSYVTLVGGQFNNVGVASHWVVVGGGYGNIVGNLSQGTTIGGGSENTISEYARYATIPGGSRNLAGRDYAFAAGRQAKANHQGAFVWGDSTAADVESVADDSVTMRASGGYRLFSDSTTNAGVSLAPGGTAWAVISDRNAKKDFAAVDTMAVLEKLAAIPITQWHYRWENEETAPHIGPMAQDFKTAFYPGSDDKSITTQEADGVALAAIQGLNQKLEQTRAENAELKARLEKLERLLDSQNGGAR